MSEALIYTINAYFLAAMFLTAPTLGVWLILGVTGHRQARPQSQPVLHEG